MRVKCPSCDSVSELHPPVVLGVCRCGALIRARITAHVPPQEQQTTSAQVDHYAVLGVDRTATSEQIKAAYRLRVKATHPDTGGDADEFRLVQSAYETLSNPELRKIYDRPGRESVGTAAPSVIPDVIGKKVLDAVRLASRHGLATRIAIIEVPKNSELVGRVVGQVPYPGTATSAHLLGLIVAVSSTSTLWDRFKAAVTDLSVGFVTGLKTGLFNSPSQPREIGASSTYRQAANNAGEVVGSLAVGAVEVTATALGCLGNAIIALGLLVLFTIGFAVASPAPPVGLAILALAGWLTYKFFKSFDKA